MEKEQYEILYRMEESHWWYLGMQRIVGSLLDRYLDRKGSCRILDAGCGTGGMMQYLRRYGSVVGVDVAEDALGWCQQRSLTRIARGSVERLPFADHSFDLLVSFDVIYHRAVVDDCLALKEFYRVLRPGGLLVLRVPAYNWLRGAHDVAVHTERRYSRLEVGRKLGDAGFRIQRLTHVNSLLLPIAVGKRLLEGDRCFFRPDSQLPSPLLNRALSATLALESALLPRVSLPLGLSVMAVARKANDGQRAAVGP